MAPRGRNANICLDGSKLLEEKCQDSPEVPVSYDRSWLACEYLTFGFCDVCNVQLHLSTAHYFMDPSMLFLCCDVVALEVISHATVTESGKLTISAYFAYDLSSP